MNPENGQVQFIFKYPFFKRGRKTLKEIMQLGIDAIWKVFKVIYKASIGIILVFYTVLFVLVLLALVFGGRSDSRDSKIDIGAILGGLFRGILDAYTFTAITRNMSYGYDGYGYKFKTFKPEKDKGKGFVQSVFSFVFGPDRPIYDPLDDAKEAAAFIRMNNGRITAGHIVALSGVKYDEAEARLAEYAVRFNGDLQVSNEGVVVAEFTDMLNKASNDLNEGKVIFYEDEVEAPYSVTGNTTGRNFAVAGMNLFNLLMSFFVIQFFTSPMIYGEDPTTTDLIAGSIHEFGWVVIILGYFPLVFSSLFFIIPALRYFTVYSNNKKRDLNIIRKKLIGTFVRHKGKTIRFDQLISLSKIELRETQFAKNVLDRLVIELMGEINIDSDGTPIYSFDRLSKELNK